MNFYKNRRDGGVPQMVTESWAPAAVPYPPLRVSRSVARSSLHSLDNSYFRNEISRPLSAAEGFFSLDDATTNYLLEDSQTAMISTTVQCCLCKCGHKKLEDSNPLRFRSLLGYSPEVDEEMSLPFPHSQHGSLSTSPPDEEFSYVCPRSTPCSGRGTPESDLEVIFPDPSRLGMKASAGVPYFSTNTDVNFQLPDLEKESLKNSSVLSHCTIQTRQRDGRKLLFYAPGQEKLDIYNSGASFLDPIYACGRSLRNEGIQSSGLGVHFRSNQGILMPTITKPKQAMSNSTSEFPSSSSVSVSSDEAEHPQMKVGLYKTELCRSWEETGYCRYATKCQFAHGSEDLRPVFRHPKYKTELCRSFTETGLCSYGKRCRFIHSSNTLPQAFPLSHDLEKKGSRRLSIFQQLCGGGEKPPRQA